MSDVFSLFQPGLAHFRRWKETEKVLVVDQRQSGSGRVPDDLDSGTLTVVVPTPPPPEADGPASA